MTPLYAFASTDKNHAEIRRAARKAGYLWFDLFRAGEGIPDALVLSKTNHWVTFEIKSPGKKLKPKEEKFRASLPGGAPHYIVWNTNEFLCWMHFEDAR